MAKSTKHQDKVGTLENFRAPWEAETGEVEVDKPTLKRLLFNLKLGEAKALDAADDAKAELETAVKERDEAKADAEKASPDEANRKIARLEKAVSDLTAERDKLVSDKEQAELRAEVLADLPAKYAKYVTGETREDLEKSLAEVKADFGIDDKPGDGDDDDDDTPKVRTTPRSLRNPGDPDPSAGADGEDDYEAVANSVVGGSLFR